jgi:hypothetical protein
MRSLPVAAAVTLGTAALWLLALGELARQPVTHTGTQPLTHHTYR